MQEIFKTRNKIILFEIILLIVMLILSTKIYLLQNKLIDLSNSKSKITISMYQLENLIKDSANLSREYILSGDTSFKQEYSKVLDNGKSIKKLEQIMYKLNYSPKEKEIVDDLFQDFYDFVKIQKKAFALYEKNKTEAKQYVVSKHYKHMEKDITEDVEKAIKLVNERIQNVFNKQNIKVIFFFSILAVVGILFVLINIYFFVYLTNIAIKQLKEKNKLIEEVEHFNDTLEDEVENRTKEIQRLMKVKSEFLANMSHEIRTPLNAMFGFIKILQDKDYDKETHKYLSIIEKSGKNLLAIINDILDFSKIEAGKLNIEKIEFNPKEEIEVVYNLFKNLASEKNITLEINEKLEYNIISDPVRIKQVISNLLSNAIKFSHSNATVYLNVSYSSQNEKLYVEVRDEGIGIPKEKLEHIFEAFSQADTSTTRKYGGTGLGLTISNKLIELLGGELKAKSEEGKGSMFYFSIPAPKTTPITNSKENKKPLLSKKFNGKILLVEDNKANQIFMEVLLKQMGLKFDIANDGIEAIEKFKHNKYDLIFMDENMPNMNGISATKKIRKIEKENGLEHTPIVALTANAMEGDKDRFINAGMDYYLSKPLDIEKFQTILSKLER